MARESSPDRPRRRSHKGRWALAGLTASLAWASWQKHQTLRAARHDGRHTAPELSHSALVNNILMRWEAHGERSDQPPVVMIHGIPTTPRLWRHVVPRLAGTHCLAWEMVGFGWSINEGLMRDISLAAQVDYLIAWLDHQEIDRATFVGHDIGGGVLQALLALYPERVAGLVLVDPAPLDQWPIPSVVDAARMASVIEKLPPTLARPLLHRMFTGPAHGGRQHGAASNALSWAPYSQPTGPAGLAHQIRCMSTGDGRAIAARLPLTPTMPVALLQGDQDPQSMASVERLAARLSVPIIRRVRGGGHFTPEEHPEIVAEEIQRMITRVAQGVGVEKTSDSHP